MPDFTPNLAIPFLGGLDTKSDSKLTPVGKLQVLENGVFTDGGNIKKRWGYDTMLPVTLADTALSRVRSLSQWGGTPLMTSAYNLYAKMGSKWANQDSFQSLSVTDVDVPHVVGEQEMGDCISNGTITVYAWQDSRGGVRASVVDASSGAIYEHDYQIDSGGAIPRCGLVDNTCLIFLSKSSSNQLLVVPVGNADPSGDLQTAPVQITNDMLATETYDVHVEGVRTYVAWTSSTVAQGLRVAEMAADGSTLVVTNTDVATLYTVTAANVDHLSISMIPDADSTEGRVVAVGIVANGTSGFAVEHMENTLAFDSGAAYTTSVTADIRNLSIYPQLGASSETGTATYDYFISYEIPDAGGVPAKHYVVTEEQDGTVWSTIRNCSLASRGRLLDDHGYAVLNFTSAALQHCYFLYDMYDKVPAARVAYGEGAALLNLGQLPGLWTLDGVTASIALLKRRRISSLGQSFKAIPVSETGRHSTFENNRMARYDFDMSASADYVEVGNATYFASGTLLSYDGVNVEESAPFLFPEQVSITDDTPGTYTDNLTAGSTYLYRVYYERTRTGGETTRSLALTFSYTVGASDTNADLRLPTLAHTMALASGEWRIAVYRTEANRTNIFYQVTDPDLTNTTGANCYVPNDPTTDEIVFHDDMDDATLITNNRDPQSEGVLPVVQPLGCNVIGQANDRVFLAGGEGRGSTVYPSLIHFPGEPVLFSDELQFSVEEEGGDIVAMGAIDGVLIVFKERRIYAVSGDGPSDVGTGQGFNVQRVTADVGCSARGSVVEVPMGLMFKSAKGVYLIDRSFNLQYIGWPVEDFNDLGIVSAEVIPDENLVVFLTSSGNSLAYDYTFNQWTTFTGHTGLDAIVIAGDYHYLRSDGEMYTRNPDVFLDAGGWYSLRLRTAPIRLSSVQDYLQVRRVNILGEYLSSHRLQMKVWCNRDLVPFETRVFEADDVVDTSEWGDADTDLWGDIDTAPWSGLAGESDYQFQHKFKRQKVQSLRLEFEDLRTDGAPGQSYELAEMNFEIGLHEANARVPSRRKL